MRLRELRKLVDQLSAGGSTPVLHEVGAPGQISYTNSYTGVGIGAFYRTNGDRTELEGRAGKAAAAAAADVIFELPEGNRPERNTWLKAVITDNDTSAELPNAQLFVIAETGQVMLTGDVDGVTNIRVSLDGLSFRNAPAA